MSSHYRYPGARPFEVRDSAVFFGRETDIRQLSERLQLEPLLVLYAKSGLGKSSLLNAGLLPLIEKKQSLKPFSIRFQAYQKESDTNILPLDRTREILDTKAPLLDQLHDESPKSLWYLVKAHQLMSEEDGSLLIFDQFEELFTYPTAAIEDFARQLSELLYTTIPDTYRKGLEHILNNQADSIAPEDLQRLHRPFRLRVVMAIRSDRYHLLDRLKPFLPTLLDNTYELQALNRRQAEDAILNPAYESNGFISPQFDFEDAAVDHLIDFLSQDVEHQIESFQLQILCEYIERKLVLEKEKSLIRKSDLANPQQILEDYYLDKIEEIEDPDDRLAVRKLIEEGLIFEEEERRLSLYEGQIESSYQVGKPLLDRLVATHLIRAEPSLRGGYTYELSHDTLVAPVLKAKAIRVKAEEETARQEREAAQERALAEERKKRNQARRVAAFMSMLAVVAIAASIFAFTQFRSANVAKADAEAKQLQAEQNLKDRIQLEIGNLIRDAELLKEAGQFTLARQKIETGLELDSTNTLLLQKLEELKNE
jgi:hypothetical protein